MKILYFHGRQSSTKSSKAEYIRQHRPHDVYIPAYPSQNRPVEESFPECYPIAQKALQEYAPDLIIGSSFGGGILLKILTEGLWKGPSLLLAGAGVRYNIAKSLPLDVPALLIHGTQDKIVDVEDSRILAASSPHAQLIEIQDNHSLKTILNGLLLLAVDHLLVHTPSKS